MPTPQETAYPILNKQISKHTLEGAVAEFERSLILDRQKEGINKALQKGVKFGPKPAVDNEKLQQIIQLLQAGRNKAEIARELKISRQTLYKALKVNEVEIIRHIQVPSINNSESKEYLCQI